MIAQFSTTSIRKLMLVLGAVSLALGVGLAVPGNAHAATGRADGPSQRVAFLEIVTPHRLCLWTPHITLHAPVYELPCHGLSYEWERDVYSWGSALLPNPAHNARYAVGDVRGHIELVPVSDFRSVATFGVTTFGYNGVSWTVIRWAHQPWYLGERGRGKTLVAENHIVYPWSGLYFVECGRGCRLV